VEQWEEEKWIETILPQKINECRILGEMKKMDTLFWTPTIQRKVTPRNPIMSTRTISKRKSCK
jgi:hypothetical protein